MSTFSTTDIIFATIIRGGRALLSTRISGIDSFNALVGHLRQLLANNGGKVAIGSPIMTVNVRNHSQGWTASRSLILA